jgi:hypothetical protein
MIVTRIQLYCDGEHGIEIHFPEDAPMDGAILTPHELRKEAKKAGWARIEGQDLCPDCKAQRKAGLL